MFSAFNPSKCTHTWSSGQPTLRRPGSSRGFGALLKGLTSAVDTSCQSRDSNPQPRITSGFKSNALSIRATTAPQLIIVIIIFIVKYVFIFNTFVGVFSLHKALQHYIIFPNF